MSGEYEDTNPGYFRNGKNVTGSTIVARRFLDWGTNENEVTLPAATTSRKCAGVSCEALADQDTRSIQNEGIAIVEASAPINANTEVQSGTDGRAATATTGNIIRGRTKTPATGAGDFVAVDLYKTPVAAP